MLTYDLTTKIMTDPFGLADYLQSQFPQYHFYVKHNHLIATMSANDMNKIEAMIRDYIKKEVL